MTDPMKPLGLSFWQLTTPAADGRGRRETVRRRHPGAGLARESRGPAERHGEIRSADSGTRCGPSSNAATSSRPGRTRAPGEMPPGSAPASIETDAAIVTGLIERSQAAIATLKRDIRAKSGPALADFILANIQELRRFMFDPQSLPAILAGMQAAWRLNERLEEWLGEKNAADTLTQSVPGNVTSEMGLALLDVADVIRPHPDVVAFLQHVEDEDLPRRTARARRRARSARRHRGLPRQVRHALRRRDRHHQATLERAPQHARALDPRQHQERRAGRRPAALRAGPAAGPAQGTGTAGALAGHAGRRAEGRRGQAADRPDPDLRRRTGSIPSTTWSAATSFTSRPC